MVITNYKTITWSEYTTLFEQIISGEKATGVYLDAAFFNYVKLNKSRMDRWLKSFVFDTDIIQKIKSISSAQKWVLITEPWCGDAAHSTPIIYLLSQINPNISLEIVLRDENLELMDMYLTNGSRSIPKLIVRDTENNDLFVWGARPVKAQLFIDDLKKTGKSMDDIKVELQKWYNTNQGKDLINEIIGLLAKHS